MKKVTNGFKELSFSHFGSKLQMIVGGMKDNAYFTNLQAAVVALSAAADEYYALAIKAEKRDRDVLIERNASRLQITNMLHDLGVEVTAIAKGNEAILSSSGFSFTQTHQKSSPLQKPKTPVVTNGVNSGVATCKVDTQYAVKSATYYLTTDPTALEEGVGGWQSFPAGGSTYDFTNLVPGQRYYAKVALIGVRDQVVMSEPVSFIAQ